MKRNLKVYYCHTTSKSRCYCATKDIYNPKIMLTGKWLKALGFGIGDRITLNCEQGRIVIENNDIDKADNADAQMALF